MKIELSPVKIVKGAVTVWNEYGPGVDIVMDLKKLTFAPGLIDELYAFHVLDHLFEQEIGEALSNWRTVLKRDANLFVVVDDFEYVARAFVGGDIDLDIFNRLHAHPMNFRRENLVDYLAKAGFLPEKMRIWMDNVPDLFDRKHFELVVCAQKHA